MVFKALLVLICGLPFGHLLFKGVDLWQAQGHYFQIGLLIVFCCSLMEKPKSVQVVNKPLAMLTLWLGLTTGYLWFKSLVTIQQYAVRIFFPFFNWLCFVWFYKLCLEYLDEEKIERILKYFSYSILVILFYSVLQYFWLDEFLRGLSLHDELVGTIGNTSHLAGILALSQPLFFKKGLRNILTLALLWILIFLCNSASGLFIGLGVVLFWLFMKKSKWFWAGLTLSMAGIGLIMTRLPGFLTSSHRLEIWQAVWGVFTKKPLTGFGLGSVGLMNIQFLGQWRQLHNEYYQIAVEVGIIGLILTLWCIWDYFQSFNSFKTDLTIKLASIFFGFCLLSSISFPGHLWQVAIFGMFAYSGIFVIKNNSGIQCLGV